MNALQFSTKQFFTIITATVFITASVFALGLLSASLISEQPATVTAAHDTMAIEPIAPEAKQPQQVQALVVSAEPEVPFEDLPVPAAGPKPVYGVQIAMFNDLNNALQFTARQPADSEFRPRVYTRTNQKHTVVYPIVVGLYQDMAAAQQAKQAYQQRFSADAFVSDASLLQDEILVSPTLAMAH